MKESRAIVFLYHNAHYQLVKATTAGVADWRVYNYSVEGRGTVATTFTDVNFTSEQATRVAMHKLSAYALGMKEGRMLRQRFGAVN